jgi:hypothetical protein
MNVSLVAPTVSESDPVHSYSPGSNDMYASVVYTQIDMTRWDEAVAGIAAVKAMLHSRPGFISGSWFAPIEAKGLMVGFWSDESSARNAAPPTGASPAPGVTVERVEIREIIDQT